MCQWIEPCIFICTFELRFSLKQGCFVETGDGTHQRKVPFGRTQTDFSSLPGAGGQRGGGGDSHARCDLFQCSVWCRPHQLGFTGTLYLWTSCWQPASGMHTWWSQNLLFLFRYSSSKVLVYNSVKCNSVFWRHSHSRLLLVLPLWALGWQN